MANTVIRRVYRVDSSIKVPQIDWDKVRRTTIPDKKFKTFKEAERNIDKACKEFIDRLNSITSREGLTWGKSYGPVNRPYDGSTEANYGIYLDNVEVGLLRLQVFFVSNESTRLFVDLFRINESGIRKFEELYKQKMLRKLSPDKRSEAEKLFDTIFKH